MFIAKELLRLVNDEEGLTIVEYAIAGGLVAASLVIAFTQLGDVVGDRISELCQGAGGTTTECDQSTVPQ